MGPTRRLTLRRETLAELARDELVLVNGAAPGTLPIGWCTSQFFDCDSYLRPCVTHTCTR